MRDKVLKLSASLAYYAVFSLGPMLLVVLFISNFFWRKQAVEGRLFGHIQALVGSRVASQIQDIIRNTGIESNMTLTALIGFVTLLLAATSAFTEMQDSINIIWKLKIKEEAGWLKMLKTRLLSFILVVGLGFLLLVSMIVNGLVEALLDQLEAILSHSTVILAYVANQAVGLALTTALFAIIYKVLPDALIRWKDVAVGAVFTALLFMTGRFGITFYIRSSQVGSAYVPAGSLVVLLLWIYLSASILYFGAEFTKCYAVTYGNDIHPDKYAVIVQAVQVESREGSVQENEKNRENTERELQKAKDSLDANSKP